MSALLDRVTAEGLSLQDRANLYCAILGYLKVRVGDVAFDEDVAKAFAFVESWKLEGRGKANDV